ncbi:glycine zipper 2TM domain-containing protein [Sulfurimonas sp.]
MKNLLLISLATSMLLVGCATNSGPEYSGVTYNQIKEYDIGTVMDARPVVISDNGSGSFVGTIVGTVLGSMVGRGRGSVLGMLAGGLAGNYVGSEAGKANGEELSVKLDNGRDIVVVVKGNEYLKGDRVKIIRDGNRVARVERITD